jgi:MYXO-CTERM domain-containing protein
MKLMRASMFAGPLAALAICFPQEASACGGCFTSQTENTQVSGHRMILSAGMDKTTLWDQITYSGNPESFAWVLPIKGVVDVGLSSDALFQVLDQLTAVTVISPPICPNTCGGQVGINASPDAAGGGELESDPGVEVLAQEVVGPYETVQLSASDPAALAAWLTSHGYNVPEDVQPVIDQYVSANFDFLALKLVPGEGVSSMRPVRITAPGAGPSLPLRMVAAGTGAVTPIRLWVFGEGRHEPANFPKFTISKDDLVWDWDAAASNYSALRTAEFKDSQGFAWLTDFAYPWQPWILESYLTWGDALASYADANGENAELNMKADLDLIHGSFPAQSLWLTAMSAELSRKALANDLAVNAALDQSVVENFFFVEKTVGTPPEPPSPCPPDPCATPDDLNLPGLPSLPQPIGDPNGQAADGENDSTFGGAGMCSIGGAAPVGGLALAGAAAAAMLRRRRRRG